jgi:serine protease Do
MGRGGKPAAPTVSQFGMSLSDLTDVQRKELKVEDGIFVVSAQGAASRAGIRRGDVIQAVNNQNVKNVEQFKQLMSSFEKGQIVALLIRRANNSLYVSFRIDAGG